MPRYISVVVYEITVYLPNETWKDGMKSAKKKEYKDMNKTYCEAVSVYSLIPLLQGLLKV